MAGLKNFGHILEGDSERGKHDPLKSRINFAVTGRNNLYQNSKDKRAIFLPGISEQSIKIIAGHFGETPMKIAVEGKKSVEERGKIWETLTVGDLRVNHLY